MKTFFIVMVFALSAACDRQNVVEDGIKNQSLHIGNGSEPSDLDPHIVTGVPENYIIAALFEGLTTLDSETLDVKPSGAESWTISPDQKTYTFKLRANAKWSNGDPVTANDYVYSWQRILSPAIGAEYAYMLHQIVNAEEFNTGKIKDFSQVGIKAVDELTFQVTLKDPTSFFLALLSHKSTYPVHQGTIEKHGKTTDRGTKWTRAGNLVSNGAFTLKDWKLNKVITVEKNEQYYDAASVRLNEINFYPFEKVETEEKKFRSGGLHVTYDVPLEKIQTWQKDNPEQINIHPYLGTYFYRLNIKKKPLDNVMVRKALAMSIDREAIVNSVTKGGQLPAYALTPPNTAGYTPKAKIEYNVDAAKKLLAQAGYPNGKGMPAIEMLYNTQESHKVIAEAIQQMWKKNLNIDVKLYNQDWKVYLDSVKNLDYQAARAGWIGDYADPNNFLDMFLSGGGNNNTGFASPTYDAKIKQALRTQNKEARYALYQQAEAELMDQVPVIPIYTYTRIYLKHPSVKNWPTNILAYRDYKRIYLEETSK